MQERFGVVADEIRKLAESTSDNAKQINSSISGIVEKVKDANDSSKIAAEAFAKISVSTKDMLQSFTDITSGLNDIDSKTQLIKAHTGNISEASETINGYCSDLSEQQRNMTEEMKLIDTIYNGAMAGIKEIREGTENIVNMTHSVSLQSNGSYKLIEKLESMLSEFKTVETSDEDAENSADGEASENQENAASDSEAVETVKNSEIPEGTVNPDSVNPTASTSFVEFEEKKE